MARAVCGMEKWSSVIGRILLGSAALALAAFAVLVFIGMWDRYVQETRALGFDGIYERYLASQAGFPNEPSAYRAAEVAGARQAAVGRENVTFEE
jgi:hypothetical protein